MKITIKEIAELAGVHRSTVDKVLHGRTGVSDDVRKKIQKIIDDANYTPNPIAKALKKQENPLNIAVILLCVDSKEQLQIGIEIAQEKYSGLNMDINYYYVKYPDFQAQAEIIDSLILQNVDGIIIQPINSSIIADKVNLAHQNNIPVITMNIDISESNRLCFVGQDIFQSGKIAGRLMGEFLCGAGKVAMITSSINLKAMNTISSREDGFFEIIQEYKGISVIDKIKCFEEHDDIFNKSIELIEKNDDLNAIYITCGGVSALCQALTAKNKQNDIKVICFETYPEILKYIQQNIIKCTIDTDLNEQGTCAFNTLIDYLLFDKKIEKTNIFTKTNIVIKESL